MTPQRSTRRGNPKFAGHNQLAPDSDVEGWLVDALGSAAPRPDKPAREKLAREIQIAVNRANNAVLEQSSTRVPMARLKDVSPAERLDRKLGEVKAAADALLATLDALQEYAGNYQWGGSEALTLNEVHEYVSRIALHPDARRNPPKPTRRGRPGQPWHEAARPIARAITNALQEVGYHGRKRATDAESAVAIIGARAISCAYKIKITPRGFASAMSPRDRSKKASASATAEESFQKMYPNAKKPRSI